MRSAILVILAALSPFVRSWQDLHPTSAETTRRVLKPYVEKVANAEKGQKEYQEKNQEAIQALEEKLRQCEDSKPVFQKQKTDEKKVSEDRIAEALATQKRIRQETMEKIRLEKRRAAELRKKGKEQAAKAAERAAARLQKRLNEGSLAGVSKKLKQTHSLVGWTKYIEGEKVRWSRRAKDFASGKVWVKLDREISRNVITLNQLEALIQRKTSDLEKARRREPGYHLKALGGYYTGQTLDKKLVKQELALQKVCAEIQAGTFSLRVPILDEYTTRNKVQKKISEAKRKVVESRRKWAGGEYRQINPTLGTWVTNGQIQKTILKLEGEVQECKGKGNRAGVYVKYWNGWYTGEKILERRRKAKKEGDERLVASFTKAYDSWKKGIRSKIELLLKRIKLYQKALQEHKKLWEKDVADQIKHIQTTLKWALGETPSGSGGLVPNPQKEIVDRHKTKLKQVDESERRLNEYGDKIFLESDGTVHGDPREAWKFVLRDASFFDPRKKELPSLSEELSGMRKLLQVIQELKPEAQWATELSKVLPKSHALFKAGRTIGNFIKSMEEILLIKDHREFQKKKKALRQTYDAFYKVFDKGCLSPSQLDPLIDGLEKMEGRKAASNGLRKRLKYLKLLREKSQSLKGLGLGEKFKALLQPRKLGSRVLEKIRGSAGKTVVEVEGKLGKTLKVFDRATLVLSVANAGARCVELANAGMDPTEAFGRSFTDLAVDLVIGGFPITAAAEMASHAVFGTVGRVLEYMEVDASWVEAFKSASFSGAASYVIIEGIAWASASSGRASIAIERWASSDDPFDQLPKNVDFKKLRESLLIVEGQLSALPPGDPKEKRLLERRRAFRVLLRAMQEGR